MEIDPASKPVEAGNAVVYTCGMFDLLHVGHVRCLQAARALGSQLIVGVYSDEQCALQGRSPAIPFEQRLEMVASLIGVDKAIEAPAPENLTATWYSEHGISVHVQGDNHGCLPPDFKTAQELGIFTTVPSTLHTGSRCIARSMQQAPLRVCVVGGGNIGHVMVGVLGARPDVQVSLLTRKPAEWLRHVTVLYPSGAACCTGTLHAISADPRDVIPGADVVVITMPSFGVDDTLALIAPHVRAGALVGKIPGMGGFEFSARAHLLKGGHCRDIVLFGSQRTPFNSRVHVYGRSVVMRSHKCEMRVGTLPAGRAPEVADRLSELFNIPCIPLTSFLEVTLTPSNPILHPTRMYGHFRDWVPSMPGWPAPTPFYTEWDEVALHALERCDAEIQAMARALELPPGGVLPLTESYPRTYGHLVRDTTNLGTMIRSNVAYQIAKTPMLARPERGDYVPNFQSRYLTEDVPYGLVILKALGLLLRVPTPGIDEVLLWAQEKIGMELLGKSGQLDGRDMATLPVPQNAGIHTAKELQRCSREWP